MKKYVLFLAVAMTLSGNVNAISPKDFEKDLNTIQKSYPIIRDLRSDLYFKSSAAGFLKRHPQKTSAEILDLCIKRNIGIYIKFMRTRPFYFNLVEGLDPVSRDLNPDCGTSGNGRPVKGIFVRTQVFDPVEELDSAFKDLDLDCGTNENGFPAKDILVHTQVH